MIDPRLAALTEADRLAADLARSRAHTAALARYYEGPATGGVACAMERLAADAVKAEQARDDAHKQSARLLLALEWALGEGAAPPHAEGDGVGKGIPLTPCQMHVFAIEERRFAARQILNDVRSEVPRARPG